MSSARTENISARLPQNGRSLTTTQRQTACAASTQRATFHHMPTRRLLATNFQFKAAQDGSDRVCHSLATCDYNNEYEWPVATQTSNRVCNPLTTCQMGSDENGSGQGGYVQWRSTQKTKTSDRVCSAHDVRSAIFSR